jgi:hypothetical protein
MIGVFDAGEDISKLSFTGRDFSDMPEEQQEALLRAKSNLVFSRAEPKHKQVGSAGSGGERRGAASRVVLCELPCCAVVACSEGGIMSSSSSALYEEICSSATSAK